MLLEMIANRTQRKVELVHENHCFEATQRIGRTVGVTRREGSFVARVHGLHHVERLGTTNLTDDDAVWSHPKRVTHKCAGVDTADTFGVGRPSFEAHDVIAWELQFGSVLADPTYMPSAMAMPQSPRPFVPCFDEFQRQGTVCQDLRPRTTFDEGGANAEELGGANGLRTGRHFQHGLVFGREMGLLDGPDYWDELVPQVVWRGTDFM